MKRFFILLFITSIVFFELKAQQGLSVPFDLATNVVSLGVGVGGSFGTYSTTSSTPALSLSYERGMWELGSGVVGLGGYLGYKSETYKDNILTDRYEEYKHQWTYTIIGVTFSYHYDLFNNDRLDTYGGLLLGLRFLKHTDTFPYERYYIGPYIKPTYARSAFTPSLYIGARYYFSNNIGAFAELGYGIAYLSLGVNFRF